jgi:hypothetical protein
VTVDAQKAAEHYDRQAKLAEIARRHEAIIPGPWRWYGNTATDQVMLATTDRGRLYVLTLGTRETQYVFHHYYCESYDLHTISDTQVKEWCGGHDEFGGDDTDGCICEEIADFLKGNIEPPEGARHFSHDRRPHSGTILTRGVTVNPDLRFPVPIPAPKGTDRQRDYKQFGGHMRSYREGMPRYEVLGYRTVSEWEMDQGGVQNARDALYREDFTGLDNPNADFIQYAPEDVAYLLAEVGRLQVENEKLRTDLTELRARS